MPTTQHVNVALAIARNNSRRESDYWAVVRIKDGFAVKRFRSLIALYAIAVFSGGERV